MASVVKVESMASFASLCAAAKIGEELTNKEQEEKKKKQRVIYNNINTLETKNDYDFSTRLVENTEAIKPILKKAGLQKVFPFQPVKNERGEIVGFVPKGKNEKEIKANIAEYKMEMKVALDMGKIDQDEYDKLEENLEDLMKENEIELEEEKDKDQYEVTDKEIMDNIKQFVMHNYGEQDEFAKECERYNNLDLDERKFKLQDINSKINTQLGIAGDLHFSTNPNLKFENSFFNKGNGGYYLTEKEVMEKGLAGALYTMMEKSLMRQKEQQIGQEFSAEYKKQMHEKIMREKEYRQQQAKKQAEQQERQERKNAQQKRQYMRNMWNG